MGERWAEVDRWRLVNRPRWIEPPKHFTLQTKIKISKIKFGGLVDDFTSHANWSVIVLALATLAGDLGKPTAQGASDDRIRGKGKKKKKVKLGKKKRKTKKLKNKK